jgi:Holliday junction resolvase-like predicted endonuclease
MGGKRQRSGGCAAAADEARGDPRPGMHGEPSREAHGESSPENHGESSPEPRGGDGVCEGTEGKEAPRGRRATHAPNGRRGSGREPGLLRRVALHARHDGLQVAFAVLLQALISLVQREPRDPGERAAERFLRALGYTLLARNWRSPRDRRDEADLIMLSPDGREVVIVEVKRAAGPWDPLNRVDIRKREVLWRLLVDLEGIGLSGSGLVGHAARLGNATRPGSATRLGSAVRGAQALRVDLVGVRGEGYLCAAVEHVTGIFIRDAPHDPGGREVRRTRA